MQLRNPLELLRATTDIQQRAALMRDLDTLWTEAEEAYRPTPAETVLAEELNIYRGTVLLAAVQHPGLAGLSPDDVKASIKTVLGAGIGKQARAQPGGEALTRRSPDRLRLSPGALLPVGGLVHIVQALEAHAGSGQLEPLGGLPVRLWAAAGERNSTRLIRAPDRHSAHVYGNHARLRAYTTRRSHKHTRTRAQSSTTCSGRQPYKDLC
jgi:hypothetical protein